MGWATGPGDVAAQSVVDPRRSEPVREVANVPGPVRVEWPADELLGAAAMRPVGVGAGDAGAAWHPLLSVVVPGGGQVLQRRPWAALLFGVLEGVGVWLWADARSDGGELRDRYRSLAWEVARGGAGPEVVASFDYYERLTAWDRSGRYDADPDAEGVQPERDVSTWNGLQWTLAAGLHLQGDVDAGPGTPGYGAALETYRRRAYGEPLLWDWTPDPGARQRYRDLVAESDDRYRWAGTLVGALVANHILAGVEAFVARRARTEAVRVGVTPAPSGRTHLRIRITP